MKENLTKEENPDSYKYTIRIHYPCKIRVFLKVVLHKITIFLP